MRSRLWHTMVIAVAILGWATGYAVADDQQRTTTTRETRVTTEHGQQHAGHLTRSEMIFRSSKLSDFSVYNTANEKLGSLDDLVIDAHSGQLLYGILSSGGVLGIGDKRIAVPWNAFRLEKDVNRNQNYLVLNVDKDRLQHAPSFATNAWPNFSNEEWARGVDQFFGVRTAARPAVETPTPQPQR